MADLRDIRPDLKTRMDLISQETDRITDEYTKRKRALEAEYEQRVTERKAAYSSLKRLYDEEDRRLGGNAATPMVVHKTPAVPLADFFVQQVERHGDSATKDSLRQLAEQAGYFPEGDSGRATHATLMNIAKGGRIRDLGDGRYAPATKPSLEELLN